MTLPETMSGVVLTGHGGPEKLEWRDDLPVPRPGPGEVVIRVAASSVNNTDINTRIGWYSKTVTGPTEGAVAADDTGGWDGALEFPRIQGADACGRIAAVGDGVDAKRIGERVIARAMPVDTQGRLTTFGSERDGGFAQYAACVASDALPVDSDWSDLDLGCIPCAFSTAEGMIQKAGLGAERVLITGASGGVGAAAVQLARARGAEITAVTSSSKAAALHELGATQTLGRDDTAPEDSFDVVLDLVGGAGFPSLLDALSRGGRYVTSGAIAGPMVDLDLRTLYLRDLTLFGSTRQPDNTLPDVIALIAAGKLSSPLAQVFDLRDIAAAQEAFSAKSHVGKIALRVP